MHVREIVSGVVVIGVAVAYLAMTVGLPDRGASRSGLAPSVYPFTIGGLLLVVAAAQVMTHLVLAGRANQKVKAGPAGEHAQTRWLGLGAIFVATWVYLWLLGLLGFILATTLFLAFGARLIGAASNRTKWYALRPNLTALAYGVVTSVAIYLLFAEFLGVLLPPGLLPQLLDLS